MRNWLYFIDSDQAYHKLLDNLLKNPEVYGITYFIFSNGITKFCSDKFGEGKLIAVYFYTHFLDPLKELEKCGLDSDMLIDIYDISIPGIKKVDRIKFVLKNGKRFISEEDFLKFLGKMRFRFKDGTSLTSFFK